MNRIRLALVSSLLCAPLAMAAAAAATGAEVVGVSAAQGGCRGEPGATATSGLQGRCGDHLKAGPASQNLEPGVPVLLASDVALSSVRGASVKPASSEADQHIGDAAPWLLLFAGCAMMTITRRRPVD